MTETQQQQPQQSSAIDQLLQLAEADVLAIAILAAAAWLLPRPLGLYLVGFLLLGWISTHPAAVTAFQQGWAFVIRNAFYGGNGQ